MKIRKETVKLKSNIYYIYVPPTPRKVSPLSKTKVSVIKIYWFCKVVGNQKQTGHYTRNPPECQTTWGGKQRPPGSAASSRRTDLFRTIAQLGPRYSPRPAAGTPWRLQTKWSLWKRRPRIWNQSSEQNVQRQMIHSNQGLKPRSAELSPRWGRILQIDCNLRWRSLTWL